MEIEKKFECTYKFPVKKGVLCLLGVVLFTQQKKLFYKNVEEITNNFAKR